MPQYRYKMIRLFSHRKRLVVVFSRNPIKVFLCLSLTFVQTQVCFCICWDEFFFMKNGFCLGPRRPLREPTNNARLYLTVVVVVVVVNAADVRIRRSFVDDATNSSFFLATLTELETGGHYPLFAGIPVD